MSRTKGPVLSRRELLQRGALYGGGLWLAGQLSFPEAAKAAAESSEPATFGPEDWKAVEAITARILPTDQEPGAKEAGCVNFIDKALAHEEKASLPLYESGLRGLEAASQRAHGAPFAELDAAAQDALLGALEAGRTAGWPADAGDSAVFFETVRVHTVVGFLADPKYGGNRDFAGWKVAGYPGPRHRRGGYRPEQVTGEAPIDPIWED